MTNMVWGRKKNHINEVTYSAAKLTRSGKD